MPLRGKTSFRAGIDIKADGGYVGAGDKGAGDNLWETSQRVSRLCRVCNLRTEKE